MLITITHIAAGLLTALAAYYARPFAKVGEVEAAATMLFVAGAAELVLAAVRLVSGTSGQLLLSAVSALFVGALTWSRASSMEPSSDTEGDFR